MDTRNASSQAPRDRGDAELWRFKRARQSQDLQAAREGRVTHRHLSWFAGGKAKRLRLIDSPN